MRRRSVLIAAQLATLLACSEDEEDRRAVTDAAQEDVDSGPIVRTMDAAQAFDAARPRDGQFSAGDRFCTNWNVDVGYAAVRLLPEPLMSQCAVYGASRPANPTRGPQFLDGGAFVFDQLADFVSVEEVAPGGYASKYALFCTGCDQTYDVYDDSLRTVIGRVVPDYGYVPLLAD
jgi:hypothetical protein